MIDIRQAVTQLMPEGSVAVLKEYDRRFVVASRRKLTNDEILAAMAGWFLKEQDAEELRNLREDCEAGMDLSNARRVLEELEEIAWWGKLRASLRIAED